jgi:hypothetical protein
VIGEQHLLRAVGEAFDVFVKFAVEFPLLYKLQRIPIRGRNDKDIKFFLFYKFLDNSSFGTEAIIDISASKIFFLRRQ